MFLDVDNFPSIQTHPNPARDARSRRSAHRDIMPQRQPRNATNGARVRAVPSMRNAESNSPQRIRVAGVQSRTGAATAITASSQHWPSCCQHALQHASLAHRVPLRCAFRTTTKMAHSPLPLHLLFSLPSLDTPISLHFLPTL